MSDSFTSRCAKIIKEKGVLGFLKKINARHFDPFKIVFYPYAHFAISKEIKKSFTAESVVDFVFTRFGRYLKPYQFRTEITNLAKMVERLQPKTVLEIGTSTGGTLFIWSRLSTKDAHLISVDLPGGENDWAYPHWKENFYKKFALPPQKIDLLRGDSQSDTMLQKVQELLNGTQVDFLFIDADHSYEGVRKDYEHYAPLVRKGGIIAFHDIVQFPEYTNVKVNKLWNEIKDKGQHFEFIEDKTQTWGGIGVFIKS